MKNHLLLLGLFALILSACGNDSTSTIDETATVETAVEKQPVEISGAFAPAAEALENGEGPGRVGGLLMQRFQAVSDPKTGLMNEKESRSFVEVATRLASAYPGDTLAALPLYRAGEIVRALNNPQEAARIYAQVHDQYPSYSKAPEALFMLAFTYDEDLHQMDKAKETYEKFLRLYPDNVFAKDTPMLIENLGQSEEEILKQLEQ